MGCLRKGRRGGGDDWVFGSWGGDVGEGLFWWRQCIVVDIAMWWVGFHAFWTFDVGCLRTGSLGFEQRWIGQFGVDLQRDTKILFRARLVRSMLAAQHVAYEAASSDGMTRACSVQRVNMYISASGSSGLRGSTSRLDPKHILLARLHPPHPENQQRHIP